MSINKLKKNFALNAQIYDKITAEKVNEIIDEINDLIDGTIDIDTITPASGTLTVNGDVEITGTLDLQDTVTFASSFTMNNGEVEQATSITTGVTVNASSGLITTVSSTLAAGAAAVFTVTNARVVSASKIFLTAVPGAAGGTPVATMESKSAGSFELKLTNIHATDPLAAPVKIYFFIVN